MTEIYADKYELIRKIGSGGMSEVFLAEVSGAEGFHKRVAIKRTLPYLTNDPVFVELFFREAHTNARLTHSNIVQVYDFGYADGQYFLAMEYVDGANLYQLMVNAYRKGIKLPLPVMVKICSLAALGLHHIHSAADANGQPLGLVHRDVSPANILVSFEGAVKIADLGLIKSTANSQTVTQVVRGKYAYMAPEQANGEALDRRADLFSLGVVLYEATTLRRLFRRATEAATIDALLNMPVPLPSSQRDEYPEELERIVMNLLSRDPERRYPEAMIAHLDLERFLQQQGAVCNELDIAELMSQVFSDDERRIGTDESDELPSAALTRAHGEVKWPYLASAFLLGSSLIWTVAALLL
jgi:serine/threonine protein kinase